LTGCVDAHDAMTYTHQVFDHQAVLRPVTKASFRLSKGALAATIDKAVAIAMDDLQGPVHIDVPVSLGSACEANGNMVERVTPTPVGPVRGAALGRACAALSRSQRPLLIAGIGAVHHNASSSVKRFAEELHVPVLTTYKAKGVFPEGHPLSLGAAGLSPRA